ncbi:MAG: hypothetical protein IJW99_10590 [Clostridia bacterium]|nr:hypothetical protein [Clostridia bacterium]
MEETVNMGAKFVEAIVNGFTSGGSGLGTGVVSTFDAVTKTAEGTLTSVAEVGMTMIGFGLLVGAVFSLWRKFTRRV